MARPTLVQVSDDCQLARTREALLRYAGYSVCTTPSGRVPLSMFAEPCAVVLFCQTVEHAHAKYLARLFQSHGEGIVTVRLSFTPLREEGTFDRTLAAPVPPEQLVRETMGWQGWATDGASHHHLS